MLGTVTLAGAPTQTSISVSGTSCLPPSGCCLITRRIFRHGPDTIGAAAGAAGKTILDVIADRVLTRRIGVCCLGLERPLLLGAVNLAEVVDAGVLLSRVARPDEVRDRDGGQQADDGDHDHDFHEGEATATRGIEFHTVLAFLSTA